MTDTDKGQFLLMLLPGFLTMGIARYIGSMGDEGEFTLTLYSLALSLVAFTLAGSLVSGLRWVRDRARRSTQTSEPVGPRAFALAVLAVAVALGVLVGWVYQSDILLRGIRWLPGGYSITKRSSERPLTFLLSSIRAGKLEEGRPPSLKQREAWLEVSLEGELNKGSRRIAGYAEFFSQRGEKGEVFLSPACVETDGTWRPHEGPGIWFRDDAVNIIALVDREKHPCPQLWAKIYHDKTIGR